MEENNSDKKDENLTTKRNSDPRSSADNRIEAAPPLEEELVSGTKFRADLLNGVPLREGSVGESKNTHCIS